MQFKPIINKRVSLRGLDILKGLEKNDEIFTQSLTSIQLEQFIVDSISHYGLHQSRWTEGQKMNCYSIETDKEEKYIHSMNVVFPVIELNGLTPNSYLELLLNKEEDEQDIINNLFIKEAVYRMFADFNVWKMQF